MHGVELVAEQLEGGWRIYFGPKVVEHQFVDRAVAKALGGGHGDELRIVQRLFA